MEITFGLRTKILIRFEQTIFNDLINKINFYFLKIPHSLYKYFVHIVLTSNIFLNHVFSNINLKFT